MTDELTMLFSEVLHELPMRHEDITAVTAAVLPSIVMSRHLQMDVEFTAFGELATASRARDERAGVFVAVTIGTYSLSGYLSYLFETGDCVSSADGALPVLGDFSGDAEDEAPLMEVVLALEEHEF